MCTPGDASKQSPGVRSERPRFTAMETSEARMLLPLLKSELESDALIVSGNYEYRSCFSTLYAGPFFRADCALLVSSTRVATRVSGTFLRFLSFPLAL